MTHYKLFKAGKWLGLALVFQGALVLWLSCHVYRKIMSKQSDKSQILKNTTTDKSIDKRVEDKDFFDQVFTRDVYVRSKDNLMLHGYFVENNSDLTIIIAHGYDSSGYRKGPVAKVFYDHGFNILAPDLRAHGRSEGEMIGMGWLDHYDLLEWIELVNALKPEGKIVLLGVSMGGAAVLNATGEKLPANVKVAIGDCAFTSPWDLYLLHFKKRFPFPSRPVLDFVNLFNRLENKNDFKYGPIDMVQKSSIPTLFIHGRDDAFTPYLMSEQLYQACASEKQLLLIEKGQHARGHLVDPELYYSTIFTFIDNHI